MKFQDRTHAGFLLAEQLTAYKNCDAVVLAVPRGGVTVAYPIAHLLHSPLDLVFCKKIGHPLYSEFAVGAVSIDGSRVESESYSKTSDENRYYLNHQAKVLSAWRAQLLDDREPIPLKGKTVILVDDGIATGLTIRACINFIRNQKPKKIVLAVPVISKQAYHELITQVYELICLIVPSHFQSIGEFYESFPPVRDDRVKELLEKERVYIMSEAEIG